MNRILNAQTLTDHGNLEGRRALLDILETGLRAADPYYNTLDALHLDGELLTIGGRQFEPFDTPLPGNEVVDLRQVGRIFVFGAGKGIQRVAKAVEELLGERLTGGHLIDKQGSELILRRVGVTFGAHPVPDEACVAGCQRIAQMAAELRPDDLVITMMGNGVGSLLTWPAPAVSLAELRQMTYTFQIERGGPTVDLIPIRNHLDRMKGGQFSKLLQPARVVHLIAFDRPTYENLMFSPYYRWLHTLPDNTTAEDAVAALKKWNVWDSAGDTIKRYLTSGDRSHDTLKVSEFERMRSRVFCLLPEEIGLIPTAQRRAAELGFQTHKLYHNYTMMAEASQVGRVVANLALHSAREAEPFTPPCALISGGELLVTVGDKRGMGGRNQEYALSAALEIAGLSQVVMASVDSDGTDGPGRQFAAAADRTPVLAGGLVDGSTLGRAQALGVDLRLALKEHNSSPALYQLGDGLLATPSMSMGDLSVTLILGRE